MNAAPLFQTLTAFAPAGASASSAAWAAWAGGVTVVTGVLLWLAGSRFSQGLVTLAAVAVGALAGKKLPAWMGWGVDPIGIAFGGAFLLGLVGYLYHRMWVGVGLGVLMAGWAAAGTWCVLRGMVAWQMPAPSGDWAAAARAIWTSLGADLQKVIPWTAGGAAFVGMTLAAVWPRVAGRMFYSMLGISVLAVAGALARQGDVLNRVGGAYVQIFVVGMLVAMGMMVQWWLGPRRVSVPQAPVTSEAGE